MPNKRHVVHYEENDKDGPRPHEKCAAEFLAQYFQSDIVFLHRAASQTPDLFVLKTNIRWELKAPKGNGKHTIQNNLRGIDKQSENVILDLCRIKLTEKQAISRTKEFLKKDSNRIKRLKILTKQQKIIDIKGK